MNAGNRPRVCILAEANPFSWVPHYVNAFRECCDVITVGPMLTSAKLAEWQMSHYETWLKPNNITIGYGDTPQLSGVLPRGWLPDLIVGIAQADMAMLRDMAGYRCLKALIVIDTWQCPDDYVFARQFDYVFSAQREFVPRLRAAGARCVEWLPLACAPAVHHPVDREKDFDVSFAGSWRLRVHRRRAQYIELLQRHFRVAAQDRVYGDEVCDIMCRGKLMFNHCAVEEVNMRVFEAMCMGGPLVTNREPAINGLLDLFEDGKHLICYSIEEELVERVRHYLDHPAERDEIARAGRAEVLAKHTYRHRVATLLDTVFTGVALASESRLIDRFGERGLRFALPTCPGAVVDVGLSLDASKYALRRDGVTRVAGIAFSELAAAQRAGSYDAMSVWPQLPGADFDTAVMSLDTSAPAALQELLQAVASCLREGGELVLRIDALVLATLCEARGDAALTSMLNEADLCVTHSRVGPAAEPNVVYVIARRRTRRVVDLFIEALERIPDHGVPIDEVRRGIPVAL